MLVLLVATSKTSICCVLCRVYAGFSSRVVRVIGSQTRPCCLLRSNHSGWMIMPNVNRASEEEKRGIDWLISSLQTMHLHVFVRECQVSLTVSHLLVTFMSLCVCICMPVCVCVLRAVCSSRRVSLCTWEMCFLLPWTTYAALQAL